MLGIETKYIRLVFFYYWTECLNENLSCLAIKYFKTRLKGQQSWLTSWNVSECEGAWLEIKTFVLLLQPCETAIVANRCHLEWHSKEADLNSSLFSMFFLHFFCITALVTHFVCTPFSLSGNGAHAHLSSHSTAADFATVYGLSPFISDSSSQEICSSSFHTSAMDEMDQSNFTSYFITQTDTSS